MQRRQDFKYELMPNGEQQPMRGFAGSYRFVVNKALALQKENHQGQGESFGYPDPRQIKLDPASSRNPPK